MRKAVLIERLATDAWQRLSDKALVASGELMAPPSNAAAVAVKGGNGGAGVHFLPGQSNRLRSIDLSEIEVRGTVGDRIVFVGGTRKQGERR